MTSSFYLTETQISYRIPNACRLGNYDPILYYGIALLSTIYGLLNKLLR
jgi:hypothetical protein